MKHIFKYIEIFEELFNDSFEDNLLSISTDEIKSATVESQPNDTWKFDAYLSEE